MIMGKILLPVTLRLRHSGRSPFRIFHYFASRIRILDPERYSLVHMQFLIAAIAIITREFGL